MNESYIARCRRASRSTPCSTPTPTGTSRRVRAVIPTADRQKATVKVRMAFDALDPRILPDMGVKVVFREEPARPDRAARAVARAAPRRAPRGAIALVFVRGGRPPRAGAVTVGRQRRRRLEIPRRPRGGEHVVLGAPRAPTGAGPRPVTRTTGPPAMTATPTVSVAAWTSDACSNQTSPRRTAAVPGKLTFCAASTSTWPRATSSP